MSLAHFPNCDAGGTLGDFLCILKQNTGQLNQLFHTFAELRLIVNRIVARQSTDWLAANAQFSPNAFLLDMNRVGVEFCGNCWKDLVHGTFELVFYECV